MDRRLIERTIEIASHSQAFGSRALHAALDSSPLWGAGRVEDTYNLMGHALRKVMRVVADQQGRSGTKGRSRSGLCDESKGSKHTLSASRVSQMARQLCLDNSKQFVDLVSCSLKREDALAIMEANCPPDRRRGSR